LGNAEAVETIGAIFEGVTSIRRSVHPCYGDFGARTWVRNRAFSPLLPTIQALGGVVDRVVLELSLPEQWAERHLLAEIPAQLEIAAGIVDVKDPRVQMAAELSRYAEQLLTVVPADRLLLCPSCSLGRRTSTWRYPRSRPWWQRRDRSDVPIRIDAASATSHVR
jgi:methionine synthase II (cobalamin-independent)